MLSQLATPTRVIWGERDRWLLVAVSADIQSLLPTADRLLIPDAGHFSPEDQPAAVAEAIADFLS